MNYHMLRYVLGQIVKLEAAFMLLPAFVSLYYKDEGLVPLVTVILLLFALGSVLTAVKPKNQAIYSREGFVIVTLAWVLMSLFGALPFVISGDIPNFIDALFESVSGFTTTGSSILTEIESLPRGLLFWRSFTNWIGGMGVLVFALAILPGGSGQYIYIMRAEVPGPVVGKLVSKTRLTARILYGIYIFLTAAETIMLKLAGLSWYDSVVTAFSTGGTGGFSVMNDSINGYGSAAVELIITIFMLIFSVNFNIFYMLLLKQFSDVLRNVELKVFLAIYALSTAAVTLNIMSVYGSFAQSLRYAGFTTASIISTTGFGTADYTEWPTFSQAILVMLMLCGACAGSTCGGIKISRLIILVKNCAGEIRRKINPRAVTTLKLEGRTVDNEVIRTQEVFFSLYAIIIVASVLIVSIDNFSFEVSLSAVITCINNIGPGLADIGPKGNFSEFSALSKLVLSADMLLGRLEIFPIMVALSPGTWKRA